MMPEMIVYLLKVNLALLLFYAGHWFVLQRYTFHTLNRFYLLTGLIYSACYPMIDLNSLLDHYVLAKEKISDISPDWQNPVIYVLTQAENRADAYWQLVLFIFWTGVIFMSIRLLIQLFSLLVLHLQSSPFTLGSFKFRKISREVNPFSFWRTIYLNPKCHDAKELRSILEHEQVHVKQLHTVDVMLAELSTIFYWFNPGVWLMKKAIKANLEFITDQEVIRSGVDSKEYQYALLKSQVLPQHPLPVNNFHFLTLKKRIEMINKKPSNRINLSNYFLILPAVMLSALIFTGSKNTLAKEPLSQIIKEISSSVPEVDKILYPTPALNVKPQKKAKELTTPNHRAITHMSPVLKAEVIDTNKITRVRIRPTIDNPLSTVTLLTSPTDTTKLTGKAIYYLDGVRSSDLPKVEPDSIKSIYVIKGADAIRMYGKDGQNGVVTILTSDFVPPHLRSGYQIKPVANNQSQAAKIALSDIDQELIMLDGKAIKKHELDKLKVTDIATIEILKGAAAGTKYGEKARSGIVIITTKQ